MNADITAFHGHQQSIRFLARLTVQLFGQRTIKLGVLAQGRSLIAARGVKPHQILMGQFVTGLYAHQFFGHARIGKIIDLHLRFQLIRQHFGQP